MALIRNWRGRPRGLQELPPEVRNADRYSKDPDAGTPVNVVLVEALLSVDGGWLRITAEGGQSPVDYWRQDEFGAWVLCDNDTRPPFEKNPEPAGHPPVVVTDHNVDLSK